MFSLLSFAQTNEQKCSTIRTSPYHSAIRGSNPYKHVHFHTTIGFIFRTLSSPFIYVIFCSNLDLVFALYARLSSLYNINDND